MLCELIDETASIDTQGFTLVRIARLTMDDDRIYKVRMSVHYESYQTQSYARVEVLNESLQWTYLVEEPVRNWHRSVRSSVVTHHSIVQELGTLSNNLSARAGNILY